MACLFAWSGPKATAQKHAAEGPGVGLQFETFGILVVVPKTEQLDVTFVDHLVKQTYLLADNATLDTFNIGGLELYVSLFEYILDVIDFINKFLGFFFRKFTQ